MPKLEYILVTTAGDRLHRHICHLGILIESYSDATHASLKTDVARPELMVFASRIRDLQMCFEIGSFVHHAKEGRYPEHAIIKIFSGLGSPEEVVAKTKGPVSFNIFNQIICSQFLLFIEEHWEPIKERWGKDTSKWPSILDFARVMRNAVAHGGAIEIQNRNARSVTWRGITFSADDNGKHIIGSLFLIPDMILLMADLTEFLDAHEISSLVAINSGDLKE